LVLQIPLGTSNTTWYLIPRGISNTTWYFKYQLVLQIPIGWYFKYQLVLS
jgi:hypothetical protein